MRAKRVFESLFYGPLKLFYRTITLIPNNFLSCFIEFWLIYLAKQKYFHIPKHNLDSLQELADFSNKVVLMDRVVD